MLKVCVVEDEKSIAELIQINLEIEGYETTLIHNGREAFQKAAEFDDYALIILDVMLPEVSGLDICNQIRKYSDVPVLFLSAKGTTEDRIAGLKLGGNDYLSKPFDLEELLLRVRILTERTALSRKALQEEIHIGSKVVNFETFIVNDKVTGSTMMLSKKEIELLRLFSEKEGMVVSRDEILDKVWGKDQFPTTRTIDNYNLSFRKLFENDPKNPIYFHSVRAVGYRFTNEK
jgi:two-component system alkaline phosphatase synthesis response regulator PhoP